MADERVEAGGIRELLRVAVPLALSTGTLSVMHVTDRVFLKWYNVDAMAASLPAGMLSWTLLSLAFGTVGYINTFVAQYFGAGRLERVGASVWQGIYFSLMASLFFVPFIIFARPIFAGMGYKNPVLDLEAEYFQVLGFGAAPALLSATMACIYSGRGKTWAVFWINSIAMGANFILDIGLIFGRFGLPELGIRGAAWATILGSTVSLVCWLALLVSDPGVREFGLARQWRLDSQLIKRILKFGSPNGVMMFLEASLFNVFLAIIGQMGTPQLAATNLAFTLNTLAFIPMFGLQTAVMILVGQRIGEGSPLIARQTTRNGIRTCFVYMTIWAALYLIFPHVVLGIFEWHGDPTEFATTRDLVLVLLRFVAAYTIFDGIQLIYSGAIRGAGDTRFSLIFFIGTEVLLMVAPTWIGVMYFGQGLYWAWTCVTAWVVVLSVGFYLRFKQGKWMSMRIIEPVLLDDTVAAETAVEPAMDEGLVESVGDVAAVKAIAASDAGRE